MVSREGNRFKDFGSSDNDGRFSRGTEVDKRDDK